MFLTWLLESLSECEIAHMVARTGTLVPISENETKLTFRVPGFSQHRCCVIARGRLRSRTPQPAGPPPSGAPPRARRRPSEGLAGLRRQGGPTPASKAPQSHSRRVCGHGGAPAGAGAPRLSLRSLPGCPPGLRCSSRRALRRSRFRCPLGFPFSLSPLLYLHSINRHPPCQAPAVCPSPHFWAP